ncbi:MAG: hypothetical protein AB1390_09155 [Nitrospirota bacterium]
MSHYLSNSFHLILISLGVISGIVYLFSLRLEQIIGIFKSGVTGIHIFIFQFLILSVLYFIGAYLIFKKLLSNKYTRSLIITIFLFGVLFRVILLMSTPLLSDDIYRYLWDGRVQSEGINPYLYPPSAEELNQLRDGKIYPNINRQEFPTIYPAGAQIFFFLSHTIARDIYAFKGLLVFFDVMTMMVLVAFLRAYKLQEIRFFIYAWNPLVIYEIAGSGHLEGLTVFLVALAFYLTAINKKTFGVIALALASSTKLYPAILLPVLLEKGERMKGLIIFSVCFLITYIPYLSAGINVTGFLPTYLESPYESFNLGLKYLLMHIFQGLDYHLLTKIFLGAILAASMFFLFKEKRKELIPRYAYILIGLFVIVTPTALHPWYILWLIPFLAFYPSPAWLIFSCAVSLSYLKYITPDGKMPSWVLFLEYIPLFVLLILGYIWKLSTTQSWFSIHKKLAIGVIETYVIPKKKKVID